MGAGDMVGWFLSLPLVYTYIPEIVQKLNASFIEVGVCVLLQTRIHENDLTEKSLRICTLLLNTEELINFLC